MTGENSPVSHYIRQTTTSAKIRRQIREENSMSFEVEGALFMDCDSEEEPEESDDVYQPDFHSDSD